MIVGSKINTYICTFICLISLSVTAFGKKSKLPPDLPSLGISTNLIDWNSKQKITLLPHQLIPINYLEQNPNIKGLLVYHYLGTGKTFLALGFAERNPKKTIIILAPRFLKGHWLKNMAKYGVKNPKRYRIITHKESGQLINTDLSNTIVLLDESHRLLAKLTSSDAKLADIYSKVYLNLQKSYRILALTGTPIYGDVTDISYQINLVAGKEIIPYSKEGFRNQYMAINKHKSLLIGHAAESHITPLISGAAAFGAAATIGASGVAIPLIGLTGYFFPSIIKSIFPVKTNPLRTFEPDRLKHISSKYITYYDFDNIDRKLYPEKKVHYENVSYNNFQSDFLIRFADSQLTPSEISGLLKDEDVNYSMEYIALNATKIQAKMKERPGRGLEIGNLTHKNNNVPTEIIYPYKFKEALDLMLSTNGPVALYSHFYHNGILLFKQYLDTKGHKGQYAILKPDLSVDKYENIVNRYNEGKIKFLLIHPEITEGISLIGTRQLHILEAPFNKSIQEQIIGRAVRYKSHMHLPEKERRVDVYIWKPTFAWRNFSHSMALRENWQRNFSELNFYGERNLVDPNNDIKSFSPDDLSYKAMRRQNTSMESLIKVLKKYSIETARGDS